MEPLPLDYEDIAKGIRGRPPFPDDLYGAFAPKPRSLAGPSISLGFLDGIGKNDASALQSAMQSAESGMAQREQGTLNRVEQMAQQKYAAEINARNQLVAHANKLDDDISKMGYSYDYLSEPEKYQDSLDDLTSQRAVINEQLKSATKAVTGSPMYQGETLVDPVGSQRSYDSSQRKSMSAELEKRLMEKLKPYSWEDLIGVNSTDTLNEMAGDIDLTNADKNSVFKKVKDELIASHSGLASYRMEQIKLEEAYNGRKLSKAEYANKMVALAIERYKNDAELDAIAQKSKTQAEFVKNLEGAPILQDIAKMSKLESAEIKAFINGIWDKKRKEMFNF
jgi:hypothetical protein